MAYKKPVCDCGKELNVVRTVSVENHFKIKKDGTPSIKPVSTIVGTVEEENFWCSECRETYAIHFDEIGRMIISDKTS